MEIYWKRNFDSPFRIKVMKSFQEAMHLQRLPTKSFTGARVRSQFFTEHCVLLPACLLALYGAMYLNFEAVFR